ncbi:uncharacterized protein PV09_07129 [Verruconis gallopava]|uniref:Enoyl-CoA hydratase n=1 Tax=Verruconis gallopava TaxID=253628 RepID=A0A0D2A3F7_9PEZI|nr:uncharacterized protein PV09_07129 [Verruconis gallopava]KIW01358.1 hypothetical protein PV09_07129 [Verruconis gallopava]
MAVNKYTDIIVEIKGQIGIIKLNRPKALNSFGGNLIPECVAAFRELNAHPDTVFTVLTGEGRFFSAGADVKAVASKKAPVYKNDAEKKLSFLMTGITMPAFELMRSIIDHKKVFVLALNGPAVGGGAAWFEGLSDICIASDDCWLQVPFSALGLVPEFGSAINWAQSVGIHRANEYLMFGRKIEAKEMKEWGMISEIFPKEGFHDRVVKYLEEQLAVNDGKSMMEVKRLQNAPLRDARLIAVVNAVDALAERFVEDAPKARFEAKRRELEAKSKGVSKL